MSWLYHKKISEYTKIIANKSYFGGKVNHINLAQMHVGKTLKQHKRLKTNKFIEKVPNEYNNYEFEIFDSYFK